MMEFDVEKLKVKEQPRKAFNNLEGLAHTIKEKGILNPIIVDENFSIVCGERRYRATKMAGLRTVPVIIKKVSKDERLELQLIEDVHDNLLSPIERGDACV